METTQFDILDKELERLHHLLSSASDFELRSFAMEQIKYLHTGFYPRYFVPLKL